MFLAKTDEEVELLRLNNDLVSRTLAEVAKHIKPGVTTQKLDSIAEEFIRAHGAVPGFLGYNGYPATLCISVNDAVVHGIPSSYELREGDIVSVDCGTFLHGFYGDSAFTFSVGEVKPEVQRLLKVTRECLELGIEAAVAGGRVGDISYAVQSHAESNGYSVVRELVGHGIGRHMHEKPEVPNYGARGRGPKLVDGMAICIEPMINLGSKHVYQDLDGWTIRTRDGKPSAHFELAVVVRKDKAERLSTFKYIDEVLRLS
ncbi:MAG: type I methionyl aminopeptidase [Tenuifilum sp.]|uniref:type I methionyl aminopeptidase n=1 Tax=Tenuifilum TaxID=2760873 RepID=UPI001B730675|nr:type I methionyl aminopeptidase [Bacteroidales bacterium]HOK61001.1 type I methionyl aminopeptidase [Tenuifilum sp.]MBP9028764.1 type I methionyl aminopeptidase [Bacteroidales bacterium]HOK85663.1 type I methionyl aminopeptidase [Tenuifilum sp.]HON70381.1 type I methionyl aminopeptidase [Tenuifilum sp.]